MAHTDQEPNELPSLTLGDEEIRDHKAGLTDPAQTPKISAPPEINRPLWLILALMLTILGAGSFYGWQQQEQLQIALTQAQTQQQQTTEQLHQLQQRLQTADTLRQTEEQTQLDQLELLAQKLDQLRELSGQQNRPMIEQLEKSVIEQQNQLNRIDQALKLSQKNAQLLTELQATQQTLGEQLKQQKKTSAQQQSANDVTLALLQEQLHTLERQQKKSIQQQQKQDKHLQTLVTKADNFDDAVRSLDTYRQQINRQLINLQNQLQTQ